MTNWLRPTWRQDITSKPSAIFLSCLLGMMVMIPILEFSEDTFFPNGQTLINSDLTVNYNVLLDLMWVLVVGLTVIAGFPMLLVLLFCGKPKRANDGSET